MKIIPLAEAQARGLYHVRLSGGRAAIPGPSDATGGKVETTAKPGGGPTIAGMLANFAAATARWAKAGLPVVADDQFKQRLNLCRNCPKGYWQETARFGLGKCASPGCGCTKLKLWLATEKCPLGVWK